MDKEELDTLQYLLIKFGKHLNTRNYSGNEIEKTHPVIDLVNIERNK